MLISKTWFSLKNIKNTKVPKITSIDVDELILKSNKLSFSEKSGLTPKVSYFIFSLEKILSHSLTPFRDLRYFFFRIRKKKYSPEISDYQGLGRWTWVNPHQNDQKNDLMSYIFEKIQIHTILSNFLVMKMVIEDLLSVFFFPRKLGAGKKNTAIFTHSLLSWDFHPKSNFSREKKNTTPLTRTY